jgi:BirA family biotin operon repressor/biotin-[acetyl-CoA-carboxylase] ligase
MLGRTIRDLGDAEPAASTGRLSMDRIAKQMKSSVIGSPLLYRQEVASTNAEARSLAVSGAPEGVVVIAESQTAGRGRLGRRWSSPAGRGLLFSVLLRPTLPMSDVHLLTLVAGCAAAQAIESMTGVPTGIKWPNDLMLGDRKVGGVLMEIAGHQDAVDWVIAGIGINVNTELGELPATLSRSAGSLKSASGAAVDRSELLARILLMLDAEYAAAMSSGFARALDGFRDRDYLLGRSVSVQTRDGGVPGRAAGINERGALLVQVSRQQVRCFHAGDVTLRT